MRNLFCLVLICILCFPVCIKAQDHSAISEYIQDLEKIQVAVIVQDTTGKTLFESGPDKRIPSASIIKIPILMTLFEQVEEGVISLNENYELKEEDKVGGSGELQHQAAPVQLTYGFLAREMIRISDNTATNILIRKIGIDKINRMLYRNGLVFTRLDRMMMDFDAIKMGKQNYTSPKETIQLLRMLLSGNYLTTSSREQMLQMLMDCADKNAIPGLLPDSIQVAHKTGTLDYVRGDAGIIFTKTPFLLAVFVEEFSTLTEADEVIGKLSKMIYENLK